MLDSNIPLDIHLMVKWDDFKLLSQKLLKDSTKKIQTVGDQLQVGGVVRRQSV